MLSKAVLLADPQALAIVLAGTALATLARCGWRASGAALRAALEMVTPGFAIGANRAALARTALSIAERGYEGADICAPPDPPLAALLDTVVEARSTRTLQNIARARRARREHARRQAQHVFESAGELAPIFGLVGTLFAISQLVPQAGVSAAEATMASVATAVLSSLYGVLLAHFVCLPLARAIERRGRREETERAAALEWFESALTGSRQGARVRLRGVA